jgi:hypothetical protein
MAMGSKFSPADPRGQERWRAYSGTKAIMTRFKERYGSTQCGDVIAGIDDSDTAKQRAYCGKLIEFVYQQAREVMEKPEELSSRSVEPWADYWNPRERDAQDQDAASQSE